MKRVGIVTFHRADNYGAVLQNYALQKALGDWCNVETVNYKCDFLEKPYLIPPFSEAPSNLVKKILNHTRYLFNVKRFWRLRDGFERFRKNYLKVSREYNQHDLIRNSNDFDVYITGSDQVWNDKITNADIVYSLGFETKAKKVSYAASAGSIQMINRQTLNNISQLDYISVREKDLQEYLVGAVKKSVSLVVDPVFLLSKENWENLLPKTKAKDKFIFTYSVSEMTDDVVKVAKHIARQNNTKIYHMDHSLKYGARGICKYGASPLEFITYIRDAEMIIASSFHAVAFSIIFGKKFIVVPTKKTASRIESLLQIVGVEENMFVSYEEYINSNKDVKLPDIRKLDNQITKSFDFLKNTIE